MPTLLIDGDILAYRAAVANQETVQWEPDGPEDIIANRHGAVDMMEAELELIYKHVLTEDEIVCLSSERNWRKELWPEYKANREHIVRPVLLDFCKEHLRRHHRSCSYPRLEADDVMGLLATDFTGLKDTVIVSIDKDMQTVPGKLFNPNRPEAGVRSISEVDAFRSHMMQTLTGDATDGYKGCPGIGPKKAEAILNSCAIDAKNNTDEWRKEIWQTVLNTFLAKGHTGKEALLNARLANILTNGQYNLKSHQVLLWRPPA